MFRDKTVFVVAAGASAELGLPIGTGLKDQIRTALAIEDVNPRLFTDEKIFIALMDYANRHNKGAHIGIPDLARCAFNLSVNMPLAPSIDTFLDTRRKEPLTVAIGKVAIAKTILSAERESALFSTYQDFYALPVDNPQLRKSWHMSLWHHLIAGVDIDNVNEIFSNVAFVVFNYDRCLEHFLHLSLQSWFNIPSGHAAHLIATADIIHPYGKVGNLPWENAQNSTPFGCESPGSLLDIALELKTFTESTEEGTVLSIRKALEAAETLVLLGFGYLEQNIKLMSSFTNISRVFMTTYGLSIYDTGIALAKIAEMIDRYPNRNLDSTSDDGDFKAALIDGSCAELFAAHRLRLS